MAGLKNLLLRIIPSRKTGRKTKTQPVTLTVGGSVLITLSVLLTASFDTSLEDSHQLIQRIMQKAD